MSNRIRIKDIAERAGVSHGTVDRVLHNRGNVSAKAKKKVLRALDEMDYSPNILASALAYNKIWKIAALIPDDNQDAFWIQPKDGILRAIQVLKDYGVQLEFFHFNSGNKDIFKKQAERILEGNFNAVIISPIFIKESLEFFEACEIKNLPFVQINTFLEFAGPMFLSYIGQDSYHSGRLAARLMAYGLNKGETALICHLEDMVDNAQHLIDKENGFREYFYERPELRIGVNQIHYTTPEKVKNFSIYLEKVLSKDNGIKGLFVTTSKAFYVVKALNRIKRKDIRIVGFDLIPDNIKKLESNEINFLINQNPEKQGYFSVINIFNFLIRKMNPKPIQHLPLDVVLKENVSYYIDKSYEEIPIVF